MKRLLYPKTYARLVEIIREDHERWIIVRGGKLVRPHLYSPIYIFETDNGERIEAKYPRTSGHTPNSLSRQYREKRKESLKLEWDDFLKIARPRVKLYKRPQDGDRWSYRHIGQ